MAARARVHAGRVPRGATLLALPLALRDRARRYLVRRFAAAGVVAYLLTLSLLVGAGWFRALVLRLPFGDVYLHNPGAAPLPRVARRAGARRDRDPRIARGPVPRSGRPCDGSRPAWACSCVFPLVAGANPGRLVVFAVGLRRDRSASCVGSGATTVGGRRPPSSACSPPSSLVGAAVVLGVRGRDRLSRPRGRGPPGLVAWAALRWPTADLEGYLRPGPIARRSSRRRRGPVPRVGAARRLLQQGVPVHAGPERTGPRCCSVGRSLFEVCTTRSASRRSSSRATGRTSARRTDCPVFYNASVIQIPSPEDVRLLGIRYLLAHESAAAAARASPARSVARDGGYLLHRLEGAGTGSRWCRRGRSCRTTPPRSRRSSNRGFDPADGAVVESDPGIDPVAGGCRPASRPTRSRVPRTS